MSTATLSDTTIIDLALHEDLAYGDLTTDTLFKGSDRITTAFIETQQPGVISGLSVAQQVFERIDESLTLTAHQQDGDCVAKGEKLLTIEGSVASILKAERLALNFIQHLSGIATLTYQYVATVSQTQAKITHTRKTMPGLRHLESEAVCHGGGVPHRLSLSHAVMVKDNHIAAVGSITQAVTQLKERLGHTTKIEVECETIAQVEEAVQAGADIVLLDNMPIQTLKNAVKIAHKRAITEASGGITLDNVLDIAKTGVDYISTSAITLSAPAFDVHLEL